MCKIKNRDRTRRTINRHRVSCKLVVNNNGHGMGVSFPAKFPVMSAVRVLDLTHGNYRKRFEHCTVPPW